MNKKLLVLIVVIIGLAVFFMLKPPSPEEQIKNQLAQLKQSINSHQPSQNPIQAMKIARELTEFASNDIVIQHQTQDIKYDFITEKKELNYSLVMGQRMYDSVNIDWLETQINILSEYEATVDVVIKVLVKVNNSDLFEDVIPARFYLSKIEDNWKITKAYNLDPFE
ncbi:MAG: hypothetical protein MK008_09865 [Bdellovibrionales bacterium]|nr:hypothetical protein [Bdellovibrionales bacterium]